MSLQCPLLRLLLLIAVFFASPALHAQPDLKVSGELVAEAQQIAPGEKTMLALYMTPQPGWHGYWKNGGDAGFGMELEWSLPKGVSIATAQYPVPHTYVLQGLMNHVYEQPYAILFDLKISSSLTAGTRLPISAKGNWLACSDSICLPQSGSFQTILTVGEKNTRGDISFDDWLAALPTPLGEHAIYALKSGNLHISIPYPAAAQLSQPHFFAESEDVVNYAAAQSYSRKGDRLIVSLPAAKRFANAGLPIKGVLRTGPDMGLEIVADSGNLPASDLNYMPSAQAASSDLSASGFAVIFMAALLGGLMLNIMPCVFPILGIKALSLAKSGISERQARSDGLAYSAGAILTVMALGGLLLILRAAGEQVGWAFQLQNPAMIMLLLLLMSMLFFNLIGLFELPAPSLSGGIGQAQGAFWTGALAAFIATPCTGPFMAAALGAALLLPVAAAMLLFFALGLGLALPFLAIGLVPALRRRIPKPGAWMNRFRKWMALPIGLTALALAWLWVQLGGSLIAALLCIAILLLPMFWLRRRQSEHKSAAAPLAVTIALMLSLPAAIWLSGETFISSKNDATSDETAVRFSAKALADLRAKKTPVFLYFTADWCITCKANEAAALNRDEVRAAFERADIQVMRGDFTRRDAEIARFLASKGRAGVPLYLYYPADGSAPNELPQILTQTMLLELAATRK